MKIVLHHGKNPDLTHGQGNGSGYWDPPRDKRMAKVSVATIKEAVTVFRAWISRNGLGGGNMEMDSGNIVAEDGQVIANVSFNGRVWTPDEYPHCAELVVL